MFYKNFKLLPKAQKWTVASIIMLLVVVCTLYTIFYNKQKDSDVSIKEVIEKPSKERREFRVKVPFVNH